MIPCLEYSQLFGNSNLLWPFVEMQHSWQFCACLYSTVPSKHCKSRICYDLAVLSTLYHEKLLNEKELKDLKEADVFWGAFLFFQCIKPPVVCTRTAEVLDAVGYDEEANLLRG